jgi:hypothetical protein
MTPNEALALRVTTADPSVTTDVPQLVVVLTVIFRPFAHHCF